MFRRCAAEFQQQNIRWCIVGALRRRCFPMRETTGRLIAAPTPTEISARPFGGTICVRADSIRPPTLQVFEQNRYTPTKPLMLQMYHVSAIYRRIAFANVDIALSAHCADVVSPWGNNRAANSRPYMAYATELPVRKFRCAKGYALPVPYVFIIKARFLRTAPLLCEKNYSSLAKYLMVRTIWLV